MGLDMYLFSMPKVSGIRFYDLLQLDHRISDTYNDTDQLLETDDEMVQAVAHLVKECGQYVKWLSMKDEVMYWRKANQIHDWFVRNVQDNEDDCDYYTVSREDIETLLSACEEVLEHDYDEDIAEDLLPTCQGFFFGSYEYDEYYYDDIRTTIDKFRDLLANFDFDKNYLMYTSSW